MQPEATGKEYWYEGWCIHLHEGCEIIISRMNNQSHIALLVVVVVVVVTVVQARSQGGFEGFNRTT